MLYYSQHSRYIVALNIHKAAHARPMHVQSWQPVTASGRSMKVKGILPYREATSRRKRVYPQSEGRSRTQPSTATAKQPITLRSLVSTGNASVRCGRRRRNLEHCSAGAGVSSSLLHRTFELMRGGLEIPHSRDEHTCGRSG